MKLTESRLRMLCCIASLIELHGYPPTVREIGAATGYRSTQTVFEKLRDLERLGLIERKGGARQLRLTEEGRRQVEQAIRERATA